MTDLTFDSVEQEKVIAPTVQQEPVSYDSTEREYVSLPTVESEELLFG